LAGGCISEIFNREIRIFIPFKRDRDIIVLVVPLPLADVFIQWNYPAERTRAEIENTGSRESGSRFWSRESGVKIPFLILIICSLLSRYIGQEAFMKMLINTDTRSYPEND
jgi:hypothetical protein